MSFPPHICLVSDTAKVSFDDLKTIAAAIDKELAPFCDAWDLEPWKCDAVRGLTPTHIRVSQLILTVKDQSSVADALGWHTEENGKIFGEIAAADILGYGGGLTTRGRGLSVSAVIAHEVFETIVNPNVNLWVDRGDGVTQDAREACDAVQGSSFNVDVRSPKGHIVSVDISNYLLPAWFDAQNTDGPYDKLGLCKKPFEVLADGYHVIRKAGVEESEDGPKPTLVTEALGSPSLQTRALTKRRPRALHGLGPAFYEAPPAPLEAPLAEGESQPQPPPSLELAPTDPAPAPEADAKV